MSFLPRPRTSASTPQVVPVSLAKARARLTPAKVEARLKRPRGRSYLEALTRLDAGSHVTDSGGLARLLAEIHDEFADVDPGLRPLGFVQKCILAPGLEVHLLDVTGEAVVRHYRFGEPMPAPFEAVRALAIHPGHSLLNTYAFIEVYLDRWVAVRAHGPVTCIDPTSL